jgi:hypothetical protein
MTLYAVGQTPENPQATPKFSKNGTNTLPVPTPVAQSKPRGGFIPNIPKERPMVQSTPSPALARGRMMDAKPRGRFNKGGTTKLHSITKSNKKSNW